MSIDQDKSSDELLASKMDVGDIGQQERDFQLAKRQSREVESLTSFLFLIQ